MVSDGLRATSDSLEDAYEARTLALELPPDFIEGVARRVAELLSAGSGGSRSQPDGWIRGAQAIADYIDAPPSRVYALATCRPSRIPVERDGRWLVARRSALDAWMRTGGGTRP